MRLSRQTLTQFLEALPADVGYIIVEMNWIGQRDSGEQRMIITWTSKTGGQETTHTTELRTAK